MTKRSYAKVNIFLKIVGKRGDYHEIASRFVRVKNLFDTVSFEKGLFTKFTLEGDFGCRTKQNTIYKAYLELSKISDIVSEYFTTHKVVVDKNIPEFAGLGGGSSNCATFMIMVNDVCSLGLSKDRLAQIGSCIGADVPFFIYEYDSANVTGIGEIVNFFDEKPLSITVFTPDVKCDTGKIFREFRKNFYEEKACSNVNMLLQMQSCDILADMNILSANDLYCSALKIYKELNPLNYNLPTDIFFSGSGSSFFYITR